MRVKVFQDAPAEGPTTLTYVFGRVTVSTSDVKDDFGSGIGLPIDVPTAPGAPAGAGGVVDTPAAPTIDSSGLTPGGGTGAGPALPPVTLDGTGTQSAPQASALGLVRMAGSPARGRNTSLFYLVLVLAGGGVLIGQQLFSRFGVRLLLRSPA
jgi:hypothetical protein